VLYSHPYTRSSVRARVNKRARVHIVKSRALYTRYTHTYRQTKQTLLARLVRARSEGARRALMTEDAVNPRTGPRLVLYNNLGNFISRVARQTYTNTVADYACKIYTVRVRVSKSARRAFCTTRAQMNAAAFSLFHFCANSFISPYTNIFSSFELVRLSAN
jgi:hypothetical protein